jgi:3-hydroxyacyl-CoA dehydrogenase
MTQVTTERHGNVAVLTLDNPPVNGLGAAIRQGLSTAITQANADDTVAAIVIRGKGAMFSGGADIREFNTPKMTADPRLPQLCAQIEGSAKPVIAAIHGTAAGGGLEIGLSCHYRIASRGAQVGLPEVKLGLVPGSGGTQRLPRMIGIEAALDVIVSGDLIPAERAAGLGILDRCVDGDILDEALAFAATVIGKAVVPTSARDAQMTEAGANPGVFDAYRKKIAPRARGFEAPYACVDCVEASVTMPFDEGMAYEREVFMKLVGSVQSKAMQHAFFADRAASRVADLPKDAPVKDIARAAVIGCGTMGGGIAMNFASAGIPVRVLETEADALDRGLAVIRGNYAASEAKGRLPAGETDRLMALIEGTTSMADLADADIVIEAVFEDMALKKTVFAELDKVARADAILATNTSTLDVDEIAAATSRPHRVVGTHFFSPANVMRLLENVRGAKSDAESVATIMALARRIGKVGVLSGVCDGFIGNRMLDPYLRQAGLLLEEGCLPEDVDRVIHDFGFAMGPFAMSDLAGVDVGWLVRQERLKRYPDLPRYSEIGDRLYELGRYGQKTGAGWYRYDKGSRTPVPDPVVEELVMEASARQGIERRTVPDEEILERCLFPLINEAARILEEGIAQRASDIDVVWIHGYGFPRHRGGPMFHADQVGAKHILEVMQRLHNRLGKGLEPAPLLVELAKSGKGFLDLPDPYRP